MVTGNFSIALDSIKSSRLRSFLTMLGIIVGVVSVVTVVSIGEGVKRQISGQINQMGPDVITVRPGKPVTTDSSGNVTGVNVMSAFASASLVDQDINTIRETDGIHEVVPLSYVVAAPKVGDKTYSDSFVLGTTSQLPSILNQKIKYGAFFEPHEETKNVAVIGVNLADQLFGESVPIGSSVTIRGESFIVRGIFDEFTTSTFVPNTNYNNAIFIPYTVAKKLSNNQANIQQILAKPSDSTAVASAVTQLETRLLNAHAGQDDFTVLEQKDTLAIANTMLDLLTLVIGAIAAVSLLVGGIGIMNVMFVSITERLHEIGVRKAVGATNQQILTQFMVESSVISFVGGVIGIIASFVVNGLLRITTSLEPVITFPVMGIAIIVAVAVGTLFGIAPAFKAARKDPIEALRRM